MSTVDTDVSAARLVAGLDEPAARLPALAGGKGASLARMTAAGLPVPAGFVVTTEAFKQAASGLPDTLFVNMTVAGPADAGALEMVCSEARLRVTEAGLSREAADAVRAAYRDLGDSIAVSVRSSATAEDLADASFAGQYDTFLNVTGEDAVLEAVVGVWASMYSAHAVAYRLRLGMDTTEGSMAVVVQTQLAPDAAGVMFTRDPITGSDDRYLVNAALGLGEGVVSGEAPADSFELDATTHAILGQTIARKDAMLCPGASGTERAEPPREKWDLPAMTQAQLAKLGAYGTQLVESNGSPQDVEFAVVGEDVHILQSRPITTGGGAQFEIEWTDPEDEQHLWTLREGPLFKLDEDSHDFRYKWLKHCFQETAVPLSHHHIYTTINGYFYMRPSEATESEIQEIQGRYREREERYRSEGTSTYRAEIEPRTLQLLAELEEFSPRGASLPELADHLEAAMEANGEVMGHLHWARPMLEGGRVEWSDEFERLTGEPGAASAVFLMGLPNFTTRLIRRLRGMARLAQANEALATAVAAGDYEALKSPQIRNSADGRKFLGRFGRLLRDYGHRSGYGYGADTNFATPTWNIAPGRLLEVIATYAEQDLDRLDALNRAARPHRVAATRRVRRKLASDSAKLAEFDRALATAQEQAILMEDHNHIMEQGVTGAFREAIHYMGVGLVAAGHVDEPDDVIHLSLAEIRSIADGDADLNARELIAARKAERTARLAMRPPQTIGSGPAPAGDLNAAYEAPSDTGLQGTVIRGVGVSPGRATGRAVVVMGGDKPPAVEKGDILIAPNAGPAWTPVFPVLGGLVLDAGGTFQHAAVIAREYGVPGVIMTQDATTVVLNGQIVAVDGTAGEVDLAPEAPGATKPPPSPSHRPPLRAMPRPESAR